MRISSKEIYSIQNTAKQLLGEHISIWLFGSRTDDAKKGGDIDLYIESQTVLEQHNNIASKFIALLQQQIGEQRIDVIIVDPKTPHHEIHIIAKATGVQL